MRGLEDVVRELWSALAKAEQERDKWEAQYHEAVLSNNTACSERDAAVADNAALVLAVHKGCPACHGARRHAVRPPNGDGAMTTPCSHPTHAVDSQPHPGAALLETHAKKVAQLTLARDVSASMHEAAQKARLDEQAEHQKEVERLSAALADVQRKVENWDHGEECAATGGWNDGDDDARECDCGKSELLAIVNPPEGSLPGAAFLARRDAMAEGLREARRGVARARNEGLETMLRWADAEEARANTLPLGDTVHGGGLHGASTHSPALHVTRTVRAAIASLREPEGCVDASCATCRAGAPCR